MTAATLPPIEGKTTMNLPVEHAFQHLANRIVEDGTQIAEILRTQLEVEGGARE